MNPIHPNGHTLLACESRAPSAPRRARSGARLAMRTRSTSRPTAVWSRPTKAPFKGRSCSASRLARWAGPDASELEPTRREPGHARIALHADPLASEGRGDPADRSRAGERIEDGPALFAAFKHRPDHRLRDRVPDAVRMGARQRQHPAQRGSARSHDLTRLPEAQKIIHAVVPALPGACLSPEPARQRTPAGATEPADDECVHPHPLGAVVAIADHQPEVAVGREDALPFTPEAHGQVVRVTLGRGTPPPSDPVRRRGQDHPDAPRRDRMKAMTVPAEQTQPPIVALVEGHGEGRSRGMMAWRSPPSASRWIPPARWPKKCSRLTRSPRRSLAVSRAVVRSDVSLTDDLAQTFRYAREANLVVGLVASTPGPSRSSTAAPCRRCERLARRFTTHHGLRRGSVARSTNRVDDGPMPVIWTITGSSRVSAKCARFAGSE